MGINSDHTSTSTSPSLLLNRSFTVPTFQVPRVLTELQQERKDSLERTKYIRRISEDKDMSWSAQRRREFDEMKKRREQEPPAQ